MPSHKELYRWFESACKECFALLEGELGFVFKGVNADQAEAVATYVHRRVAVSAHYEPLENLIAVYIVRLKNGEVREYNAQDWLNVDAWMREQGKAIVAQETHNSPFSNGPEDFKAILSAYACVIREYLRDASRAA